MTHHLPRSSINTARKVALAALGDSVFEHRPLPEALLARGEDRLSAQDRAFCRELAQGTARYYQRLHHQLAGYLQKPLRAKDRILEIAIILGLYQLDYLAVPQHAAIHETVQLAEWLGRSWARGLLNAILRSHVRAAPANDQTLSDVARWSCPEWLLNLWRRDWPDHWHSIAEASLQRPPLHLRVNRRHFGRVTYQQQLQAMGLEASVLPWTTEGLVLATPMDVQELPGFADGWVSVQDGAAQLAAPLLGARPGERVLDACAAPGGKTGHLLELTDNLDVWAVDKTPLRVARLGANLERLRLQAHCQIDDLLEPRQSWHTLQFHRILLDAPCSATGILRRHPDIKLTRQPADIQSLVDTQSRLLDQLWPRLLPGGTLLYVTCSTLKQENEHQIRSFLERTVDAGCEPIDQPWGLITECGRQILPGAGFDGFYYARLRKH